MTALHLASRNGHVEVATALLEKGAAIDLTNLVSLSCVLTLHVVMQSGVSGLATLRDIKALSALKDSPVCVRARRTSASRRKLGLMPSAIYNVVILQR